MHETYKHNNHRIWHVTEFREVVTYRGSNPLLGAGVQGSFNSEDIQQILAKSNNKRYTSFYFTYEMRVLSLKVLQ